MQCFIKRGIGIFLLLLMNQFCSYAWGYSFAKRHFSFKITSDKCDVLWVAIDFFYNPDNDLTYSYDKDSVSTYTYWITCPKDDSDQNLKFYKVIRRDTTLLSSTHLPIAPDIEHDIWITRDCDLSFTFEMDSILYLKTFENEIFTMGFSAGIYPPDLRDELYLYPHERISQYEERDTSFLQCDGSQYNINNQVFNQNATFNDTVYVKNDCDIIYHYQIYFEGACPYFFPSAFSPNDDGNNDTYRPLLAPTSIPPSKYQLNIYNRYGQLVFGSNDPHLAWDGTFNGKPQPVGVYLFYCTYITEFRKYFTEKGSITLIR